MPPNAVTARTLSTTRATTDRVTARPGAVGVSLKRESGVIRTVVWLVAVGILVPQALAPHWSCAVLASWQDECRLVDLTGFLGSPARA